MKTKQKINLINTRYNNDLKDYSKNVFVLNVAKNTKILLYLFKKVFIFLITFLFILALVFGVFLGIDFFIKNQQTANQLREVDGDVVVEIIKGILMALYIFFVPAINWILHLIQNLIYILSFYPLINSILGVSVEIFIKWTLVAFIVLGIIFSIFKLIKIFYANKRAEQEKNFFFLNIFKAIAFVFLIPFFIIFLNTLVIYMVTLIFELSGELDTDLALIIFNNSFYDYAHDFTSIPNNPTSDDLTNFSFLVFMVSTIILTVLLSRVIMDLATRIYEIVVLLFISPIVISISISDDASRFKYWLRVMNQKIFSVVFIIGTYTLFLALIPFINKFANNYLQSFDNLIQQGFIIVMILAGAFMLESSKTLVSFIFAADTKVGFATTISNISTRTNYYKGSMVNSLKLSSLPYSYGYKMSSSALRGTIKGVGLRP